MKTYKIEKSARFREQEKRLPKAARASLNKVLKSLARNPCGPNTMNLGGEPSAAELRNWTNDVKPTSVDLVLEYLKDKDCLSEKGMIFAHSFWKEYIKRKK